MAKKKTAQKKTRSPAYVAQIEALKNLSTEAAAYLVDTNASTLRSAVNRIQPSATGKYDARQLVKWAVGREGRISPSAEDQETVLRAAESAATADDDRYSPTFALDSIKRLRAKYGLRIDSLILDEILFHLVGRADEEADGWETESDKQVALHGPALQCGQCNRVRRGDNWIESVPLDTAIHQDCPKCNRRLATRLEKLRKRAI